LNQGNRLQTVKTFAELVRWEHTIFNLPFAYLGAFLAAHGFPGWANLFWITVAMFGARTASMAMNRLFDAEIDAKTPRTKNRHIPAGLIAKRDVAVLILLSLILLFFAAYNLDPICVKLFPLAVLTVGIYSFTKRFTWLCHVWLGLSVSWAPFGAFVAVAGEIRPEAFWLVAIVTLWNAGFDILYATQDMEADRQNGVYSVPARFGLARSLQIAKGFHLVLVGVSLLFGVAIGLLPLASPLSWNLGNWLYLLAWAVMAGLLHYEHHIISPQDMSRLDAAFFNVNGYLSVAYSILTAAALLFA
jgi:4-hydroxybenzoate polyprenyltransferase